MCGTINCFLGWVHYSIKFLEKCLSPLLLLAMRLWIARIFFYSGLTKINDWPTTIALFESEYKLPFLPTDVAAFSATAFELCCPILLLIGLMTRLAVLPLIAMTLVIQLTYLQSSEHFYWGFLLVTLLCFGAGKLSIDNLLTKRIGM